MKFRYYTKNDNGQLKNYLECTNDKPTCFIGYIDTEDTNGDIVIKYRSKIYMRVNAEVVDGKYVDTYELDEHYRTEDKIKVAEKLNDKTEARLEYVAMMADIDLPM